MASVSEIISNENARLTEKKQQVDEVYATQTRLMDLHNSQRKRTTQYTVMIVYLVFGALAFALVGFLPSLLPIIPGVVVTILQVVIAVFTVYMLFATYTDVMSRSSGNFDEIDVPAIIDLSGNGVGLKLSEQEQAQRNAGLKQLLTGECAGETCCGNGTVWDPATLQCKPVIAPAGAPGGASAFTTLIDGKDVTGVYINSIKSNLDGVQGSFMSSGDQYVRPELINVQFGLLGVGANI